MEVFRLHTALPSSAQDDKWMLEPCHLERSEAESKGLSASSSKPLNTNPTSLSLP